MKLQKLRIQLFFDSDNILSELLPTFKSYPKKHNYKLYILKALGMMLYISLTSRKTHKRTKKAS